jgi:hypothetical protein
MGNVEEATFSSMSTLDGTAATEELLLLKSTNAPPSVKNTVPSAVSPLVTVLGVMNNVSRVGGGGSSANVANTSLLNTLKLPSLS